MRSKNILFVVLVFSLISCNRAGNEVITDVKRAEVSIIDSLKKQLSEKQEEIDSLTVKIKEGQITHRDNAPIADNSCLGKESLFKWVLGGLNIDRFNITEALWLNSFDKEPSVGDDLYWIGSGFIEKFNRSSEFIANYFGEDEIGLIVKYLSSNDLFYKAEIDIMLEAALKAYEELNDQSLFFAETTKPGITQEEYYSLIESKYSDDVKDLLRMASGGIDNKLFMVYSFWVRKYQGCI